MSVCLSIHSLAMVGLVREWSRDRRRFSWYSTAAYHAPPKRVRTIPRALVGEMVRLNMETARRMVSTCFTLAATVMLRGPTFELAVKLTTLRANAMAALIARDAARRLFILATL